MNIERFAGVVLDAFSVAFKFICNVDGLHDLAQEGVIYKKEIKRPAFQLKIYVKDMTLVLKIPILQEEIA